MLGTKVSSSRKKERKKERERERKKKKREREIREREKEKKTVPKNFAKQTVILLYIFYNTNLTYLKSVKNLRNRGLFYFIPFMILI
jgi:hypothetical protein